MNTFNIKSALPLLLIALFLTGGRNAVAQTNPLPTLRGAGAVEELKQTGGYDSLAAAVEAARRDDEQSKSALTAPEVFGQTAQLFAADGAAQDSFGTNVAIQRRHGNRQGERLFR